MTFRHRKTLQNLFPAAKRKLARLVPARAFRYFMHWTTDAYVISMGKCGRTWLRILLARALAHRFAVQLNNPLSLAELARRCPAAPRLRFSHAEREVGKQALRDLSARELASMRVIFLVRDPRDVLVSLYFHHTRRTGLVPPHVSLLEFLDQYPSFTNVLWLYQSWFQRRDALKGFHLVRYEDLHRDAAGELTRIFHYLGISPPTVEQLSEAVRYASFDNMQKMEASGNFDGRLRAADPADPESRKVRQGKIGGFMDYLPEHIWQPMSQRIREELPPVFGYPIHLE